MYSTTSLVLQLTVINSDRTSLNLTYVVLNWFGNDSSVELVHQQF